MAAKASGYTHMAAAKKNMIVKWQNAGKTPSQVAELLSRDPSSVCRHFKRNAENLGKFIAPVGRPRKLTEMQLDRVEETLGKMVTAADSQYQVTAGMVRRALRLRCSDKTVLNALHQRGIKFRPMREKPVRTESDEKERLRFATTHSVKPKSFGCVVSMLTWTISTSPYI